MKKMIGLGLLAALIAVAFVNPLKAQDAKKELAAFVKKFEAAYNKKDDQALKEMYTKDATKTMIDGKIQNGNEEIRAAFAAFLKDNTVTIVIKLVKVTEKDGITTTSGTFHITGTSAKGEKVDRSGEYTNTVAKEDGNWKITKSILTELKP